MQPGHARHQGEERSKLLLDDLRHLERRSVLVTHGDIEGGLAIQADLLHHRCQRARRQQRLRLVHPGPDLLRRRGRIHPAAEHDLDG